MNDILEEAGYQVIVVTGSDGLASQLSTKNSHVYGRVAPMTMANIMSSVDVAVSAAGQTLNELAWLGVPTISVKTGEDQHWNWEYYRRHNLSLAALLPGQANFASILISTLKTENGNSRRERSLNLRKLLTDGGAAAICSFIKDMEKRP